MRAQTFMVLMSLLSSGLSDAAFAQGTCPFDPVPCAELEKAHCVLAGTQWRCDDGDGYEFDEGLWRTEQIAKLTQLLPALPDHASLASLKTEYDQIRMTGLWQAEGIALSIDREQNTYVEIEAWWKDGALDVTGFWLPVRPSYQGEQLDWGVGRYGGGVLEADLRVIGAGGAKISLRLIDSETLEADLSVENEYGSKTQRRQTLKRAREGKWGLQKVGFKDRFFNQGLNGAWVGEYQIDGESCGVGNDYLWGRRAIELKLKFSGLDLSVRERDVTDAGNIRHLRDRSIPLFHYELLPGLGDTQSMTATRIEIRAVAKEWGSFSNWYYELGEDGQSLSVMQEFSVFGQPPCKVVGQLKRRP